jgi:hypothetical protein
VVEARAKTKRLFALIVIGALSVGASSCGGAGKDNDSSSSVPSSARVVSTASAPNTSSAVTISDILLARRFRNDGDKDSEAHNRDTSRGYHDGDDSSFVVAAHEAETGDMLAAAAVVERYYAALAAGDGARACSLLIPKLASSVAEDYGQAPGPSFLRGGKTCPAVIALLSKHFRARLANTVTVTGVRITGDNAFVILSSKTPPLSDLNLQRIGGAWKFAELIGNHDAGDSRLVASVKATKMDDALAVASVVERYYAALAAGDGARACSLLIPKLASSVAEDYGQAPGPSFLRGGKTCPAVIALLSKHYRARLAGPVAVTAVHVYGNGAVALLGSESLPASNFNLERVGGVWKAGALTGDVLS